MGILSRFREWLAGAKKREASDVWMTASLLGSTNRFTPFHESPWVQRSIVVIKDSLASVPLRLYTGPEDKPEEVVSGPWYDFLFDPSDANSRRDFWALTWQFTQLGKTGEAFWILYNRTGLVGEGEIPVKASVHPGSAFTEVIISGRLDHWTFSDPHSGQTATLYPHQVIQFAPTRDPDYPYRGVSPMEAALRDIRTDNKAAIWNEAVLDNGARPDGVLTTEQSITTDEADALRDRWNDLHQGPGKAARVGVLGHGAKWENVTMTHRDMAYAESREWAREVVAGVFGVPLMFLGVLEQVHKETSKQVRKLFWETTAIPKLLLGEDILNARLFANRGPRSETANLRGQFDLSGIEALQEDIKDRRTVAEADRRLGVPLNQIIRSNNLPYEDQGESGEVGLVAMNLQTVDVATEDFSEIDTPYQPEPATVPDDSALAGVEAPEIEQEVEVLEDLVLNGAQIAAALNIVLEVAAGNLPRDSGLGMLETLFNLSEEQALAIMGSAGTDEPTTPNPKPAAEAPAEDDPADAPGGEVEQAGGAAATREEDPERAWRIAQWEKMIRAVYAPGERAMRKKYLGWLRGRIADTMKWLNNAWSGDRDARANSGLTTEQVQAFVDDQYERWHNLLAKQTKPVDTSIVAATIEFQDDALGGLQHIEMGDPITTDLIAHRGAEKVRIVDTMLVKRMRGTLMESVAEGETYAETQERIRGVGKVQAHEAQRIARTESAAASSQTDIAVYTAEGVNEMEWLTAGDEAVRETHQIDGEVISVGGTFSNGLKFPHDPNGEAGEVINCRCRAVAVV